MKKHPEAGPILEATFASLMEDAFQAALKTYKWKGELVGSWAYRAGHYLRIIFEFVPYEASEAILLQTIGTHDEVY